MYVCMYIYIYTHMYIYIYIYIYIYMLFDDLAVCIAVMALAVICPIAFNT